LEGLDIIAMGDVANEMYFLAHGTVDVVIYAGGKEMVVASLKDGDCFGEAALLTNSLRSATIRAKTTCELFVLSRTDFDYVLSFSNELKDIMKQITILRVSAATRRRFRVLMEALSGVPWFEAQQLLHAWKENCVEALVQAQMASFFQAEQMTIGGTEKLGSISSNVGIRHEVEMNANELESSEPSAAINEHHHLASQIGNLQKKFGSVRSPDSTQLPGTPDGSVEIDIR